MIITAEEEKEIVKCLEQELTLFIKFAHLSMQLKDAVLNNEDIRLIEGILDEKACISNEIDRLSGLRKVLTGSSSVSNESISLITKEIRDIITKVIKYERICEEGLIKESKSIGDKLLKINYALQSAKTFPKGFKPPEFLSIKL
ncbi:MAG: hypothetical protein PH343_00255 [Nitrospira sp.]|nr:hypothetical protein [Nitrospira sp.]